MSCRLILGLLILELLCVLTPLVDSYPKKADARKKPMYYNGNYNAMKNHAYGALPGRNMYPANARRKMSSSRRSRKMVPFAHPAGKQPMIPMTPYNINAAKKFMKANQLPRYADSKYMANMI